MTNEELIIKAINLAAEIHKQQTYTSFSGQVVPYMRHLRYVVGELFHYYFDNPSIICAGYLHDSIEDTNITYEYIQREFNQEIADLVWACTSIGINRKERNQDIKLKLFQNPAAIPIKLADRYINASISKMHNQKLFNMYLKEWPDFKQLKTVSPPDTEKLWMKIYELFGDDECIQKKK